LTTLPLLRVDFCCNDPDNGLFAGEVEAIQIYDADPVLELECWGYPRRFRVEVDHIVLSGKRAAYHRVRHGIGNWCWDAYWFEIDVAIALLESMHRRDFFACSLADERLFARWRSRAPFDNVTRQLFRGVLERVASRQGGRPL